MLWFDEYYLEHEDYQFDRVDEYVRSMDLALFVGTSLSVGVTELVLRAAPVLGVPVFHLDPSPTPNMPAGVHHLSVRAEEALPEVCRRVK